MKNIVVLGSTGSIGGQTLDIVRSLLDSFRVVGLAAGQNHGLLASQLAEFRPRMAWADGDGGSSLVSMGRMASAGWPWRTWSRSRTWTS